MAKQANTEEILIRLRQIKRSSISAEDIAFLIKALSGTNHIVVEQAAFVMGRTGNSDFIPHLITAFHKYIDSPERDKGCMAKESICKALDSLKCFAEDVYLRGVKHVQMEPVFGGREDVAANLRGLCALALTRISYPDIHFVLTDLLMDKEIQTRRTAVNLVSALGSERSELLLRMKALTGDEEPDIMGSIFTGLLAMATKRSIPFVAGFLSSEDPFIAGQAAAALGQSEDEDAFKVLRDYWKENTDLNFTKPLLLAIGLTRRDTAFHLLLEVVADGGKNSALAAIEALEIYASDPRRSEEIKKVISTRKDLENLH
ncbi:MAG: HEAT repeat domain-containing protein [Armatimonadota bacterium]